MKIDKEIYIRRAIRKLYDYYNLEYINFEIEEELGRIDFDIHFKNKEIVLITMYYNYKSNFKDEKLIIKFIKERLDKKIEKLISL